MTYTAAVACDSWCRLCSNTCSDAGGWMRPIWLGARLRRWQHTTWIKLLLSLMYEYDMKVVLLCVKRDYVKGLKFNLHVQQVISNITFHDATDMHVLMHKDIKTVCTNNNSYNSRRLVALYKLDKILSSYMLHGLHNVSCIAINTLLVGYIQVWSHKLTAYAWQLQCHGIICTEK